MYPVRSRLISRSMPPLPPATIVIDMRGGEEDIISMLKAEIRNLTEEMKRQNVNLWSSLADIVSCVALDPLKDEDIALLRAEWSTQDGLIDSSVNASTVESDSQSMSLFEHMLDQASWLRSRLPVINQGQSEEKLFEALSPPPAFAELPHKIDLLRNVRIRLRSDSGRNSIARYNLNEEAMRVFFLADANSYSSLASTAACAMYLKDYYRRYERSNNQTGTQSLINIAVLCLNHEGTDQNTAPEHLIEGLSWQGGWKHLDTLILIERYRQDMGQMDTNTQNLFAEQLLYVLLTVSPSLSQTSSYTRMPVRFESVSQSTDKTGISLPPNTFLVGLSAIEQSTRWGYRLLNYGVAERALQALREDNDKNRQDEQREVKLWLSELRNKVRRSLSEMLPAYIPDLLALSLSMKASSPARSIFSDAQLGPKQGEKSISELEQYLSSMARTYVDANETEKRSAQQPQTVTGGFSRLPTLENAENSIPKILDILDQWDGEDLAMPLAEAQTSAYRVLAHPDLFRGPRGAIPAAQRQLKELADAIVKHEEERKPGFVDVKERREALQQLGKDEIDVLRKHIQRWPFFAAFLRLKTPIAWATTLLLLFLCYILAVFGFAWLAQILGHAFPSVSRYLSLPFLGISALTWLNILFVIVLATIIGIALSFFGRSILEERRSAFSVEIIFTIILVAIAFFSLAITLSYVSVTAPAARTIIAWYPTGLILLVSTIAFLIALAIIIVDNLFYFSWWRKEMKRKRAAIVEAIRRKHQEQVEEVTTYIIDTLTFQLLQRAGLVPDKTGTSPYYKRIQELDRLLINTLARVEDERRLADSRLSYEVAKTSPYIREELLDVAALKNGYWRWREAMDNKMKEFRELSVMLLRAMGEERPGTIERQYRENASSGNSEPYYVQTLTGMLTAVAVRLSTTIPSADMLSSLLKRYEELDKRVIDQYSAPRFLIEAINKKMKVAGLVRETDILLAVQALVAWGQTIWEKKDPQLNSILDQTSVISRMINDKRDPQTVVDKLRMGASPSGRSIVGGLHDGLYLFVAPSPESRMFLKNVTLASCITDFPDAECLLLLDIQTFVARSLVK